MGTGIVTTLLIWTTYFFSSLRRPVSGAPAREKVSHKIGHPALGRFWTQLVCFAHGLVNTRIASPSCVGRGVRPGSCKYVGETEKDIDHRIVAAVIASAVLLLDEAEALFGKRAEIRDAHDRYANAEVTYLLQRIKADLPTSPV
ncbi:MAG: AAA family ATPase [Betaproteobacteria bacterium]|nr:MAG: AAA family ATPase [Betaproteobacteria bacterium]